jgi:hypothetical protein
MKIDESNSILDSGYLRDKNGRLIAQAFSCRSCGASVTVMASVVKDYDIQLGYGNKYDLDKVVPCCNKPDFFYHYYYQGGHNAEDKEGS